jgi:hypothetical protein
MAGSSPTHGHGTPTFSADVLVDRMATSIRLFRANSSAGPTVTDFGDIGGHSDSVVESFSLPTMPTFLLFDCGLAQFHGTEMYSLRVASWGFLRGSSCRYSSSEVILVDS